MNRFLLEDHLCRGCGGRVLRQLDHGPTPGGNPVYRCADCGTSTSSMGPDALCWCGFNHRGQHITAYRCVPFTALKTDPERAAKLLRAFRACGCEPGRAEVGIMLETEYREAMK